VLEMPLFRRKRRVEKSQVTDMTSNSHAGH
jgi:hypothetical protein